MKNGNWKMILGKWFLVRCIPAIQKLQAGNPQYKIIASHEYAFSTKMDVA
jgi:hypothetical protein